MTPSEALILRTQIVDRMSRQRRPHIKLELAVMRDAPLFIWRDDLARSALRAMASLPSLVTITPELLPTESGLYLFPHDMNFPGCPQRLSGLLWAKPWPSASHFAIWAYARENVIPTRYWMLTVGLRSDHELDGRWEGVQEGADFDPVKASEAARRYLLASWLWLQQKVMIPEAITVNSQSRKLAERAHVTSLVSVITLRKGENTHHDDVSTRSRDYSCQWLVRGHWRQQYYASTAEHRPLWIEPYVKGPEEKPLKPPSHTVFAVTR